jgi:uncharacterized RDD family membrane protein YckC
MNWSYADQGHQTGPVEEVQLDELVRSGTLPSSALVWTEGMVDWKPYSSIRTSNSIPASAPPLPPALDFSQPIGVCVCCGRAVPQNECAVIGRNIACPQCKPVYLERLREGDLTTLPGSLPYAGFWIRYAARMADYSVLNLVQVGFITTALASTIKPATEIGVEFFRTLGITALIGFLLSVGYEVCFLATRGATPGKMLCYLRVTRADGSPLGWGLAFGRYFAELLSRFSVGIGYIMAGFDIEKRALHDRVAGTRVIDAPPEALERRHLEPVDRAIRCASCQTEIPSSEWNSPDPVPCPGCNTPVLAIVFPSVARTLPSGTPEAKTGEGEAGCYYHDGNLATAACGQCGRFLCAVCDLDAGPAHLCPSCLNAHVASGQTPQFVQRRTLYDSIALTVAVIPNLFLITVYFTVFTAPAVVGFTIWSWKKPGSITPRSKWRFVLALVLASVNLGFVAIIILTLFAATFRSLPK